MCTRSPIRVPMQVRVRMRVHPRNPLRMRRRVSPRTKSDPGSSSVRRVKETESGTDLGAASRVAENGRLHRAELVRRTSAPNQCAARSPLRGAGPQRDRVENHDGSDGQQRPREPLRGSKHAIGSGWGRRRKHATQTACGGLIFRRGGDKRRAVDG